MLVNRTDFRMVFQPEGPTEEQEIGLWSRFTETPEGFLKGRAVVTNVGVFPYQMADGSVMWELRPPEEVFAPASLASLKMKPLTDDHPLTAVNSDNADQLQVGSLGDEIVTDAYRVSVPIIITKADAVSKARGGKQALSCGYSADLEMKKGNWMGVPYDAIQRNIRYNHVAIVDRGRAGDDAVMRLDSAEFSADGKFVTQPNTEDVRMKAFKFDGKEFTEESDVVLALGELKTRADKAETQKAELEAKISAISGERDSLKDQTESLKSKLDDALTLQPKKLDEAVASRLALIVAAQKAGVELKGDESEDAIHSAVILKAFPKADLSGKDSVYLAARYDAAVETLADQAEQNDKNRDSLNDQGDKDSKHQDSQDPDADTARAKYHQSLVDGWKK